MSILDYDEWKQRGLPDLVEIYDRLTYCNAVEDGRRFRTDWYFVPDDPLPSGRRVIYTGGWSGVAKIPTQGRFEAELFDSTVPDDLAEYDRRVRYW